MFADAELFALSVVMPVEHIVFLKLTRPLTDPEKACVLECWNLPGVLACSCGPSYSERGMGFNYAIALTFQDKETEISFRSTEVHEAIKTRIIQPLTDMDSPPSVLAIDFEHDGVTADDGSLLVGAVAGLTVGLAAGVALGFAVARILR